MLLRLSGSILTLVLFVLLIMRQGWDEIADAVLSIPTWRFVVVIALTLISRLAVAVRWHILLRSAGENVSLNNSIRLTFSGLFASNFLPTTIGGDVVRLAGALHLGWNVTISAASLVVDRLIGLTGMVSVLPFGLPPIWKNLQNQTLQGSGSIFLPAIFTLTQTHIGAQRIITRVKQLLQELTMALANWGSKPGALFSALCLSWLHMLCLFLSIKILLAGLNENLSFMLIAGLWSSVYFLTLLPISINGYGLQEISIGIVFTTVAGISEHNSLTLALLMRTLMMLFSLPGALFVPSILSSHRARSSSNNL